MKEEAAGRLVEHVAVNGSDHDAMVEGMQKVRCEERTVNKLERLFTLLLLLVFSSGCATISLWKHENALVVSGQVTAEVDQIYAKHDTRIAPDPSGLNKDITVIKYAISFHILEPDRFKSYELLFPERYRGYLIVIDEISDHKKDDIENKFNQGAPFQSALSFIDEVEAKSLYIVHVDGLLRTDVELNFTYFAPADKPPVLGSIVPLGAMPPFANHGAGVRYLNWEPVNSVEEKQSHYFNLCCYNGRVYYSEYLDLSGFTPILPQSMSPLRTYFYRLEPENIYKYPLEGRVIGTPFSLAFDVLTWPVQFFSLFLAPTRQVP